jgi:hypothetical protein
VRLAIQGRFFDANGNLQVFSERQTPNTDRSVKTSNFPLAPGALTNLTVFAETGAPLVGQCYVMVQLIRGLTGATIVLGTLLGGYVTAQQPLGWPGSPIVRSTDGEPAIRAVDGTTPALGAEISEAVPSGARWEIATFFTTLNTDATAVVRRVTLIFSFGGNPRAQPLAFALIGASQAWSLTFGPGIEGVTDNNNEVQQSNIPLRLLLPSGSTIVTDTYGRQAGDQFTSPKMLVREWLEVN